MAFERVGDILPRVFARLHRESLMARIRTLKPEFFQDEKMAAAPLIDRFVFLGLISMADDAGRVVDNLKIVDAFIFPASNDSAADSLVRLTVSGRLRRGVADSGQNVIEVTNWNRHQKIDKPNLKAALPKISKDNSLGGHSPTPPRYIADASALHTTTTTNDQRPLRRIRTATGSSGSWVSEAVAIYAEHIGLLPIGRIGKALKPAVDVHGWDLVNPWFIAYCKARPYQKRDGTIHGDREGDTPEGAHRDTRFVSPEDFVKTLNVWRDRTAPMVGR